MTDWTNTNGTMELDAVNTRAGSASIKLTCDPAVNSYASIQRQLAAPLTLDNKVLRVYFYVTNQATALQYVRVSLGVDAGFNNSIYYNVSVTSKDLHTGWNSADIYPGEWTLVGTATESSTFDYLRLLIEPRAGTSETVSFDSIEAGRVNKSCVLLTLDVDNDIFVDTTLAILQNRNIKTTLYIVSDHINTLGYMSGAQLVATANLGHCIANHSKTHADFSTLNYADVVTELQTCETFLNGLGLTQNSKDFAYPQGGYNQTSLNALTDQGYTTAVTVNPNGCVIPGGDNNLVIGRRSIHNTDSVASVTAWIDTCVTNNRPIPMLFHDIVASSPTTYQYLTADFITILEYCIAQGLGFITIEDYKNLANGSVVT